MLKRPYFGHLMQRTDSLEKILMLGKIEGRRRRGQQRMRRLDGITDSMNMNLNKIWEIVKDRDAWYAAFHGVRVGHALAAEQKQQPPGNKKKMWTPFSICPSAFNLSDHFLPLGFGR